MFSDEDDGVDDVLAQFIIMMYAKATTLAGDEKLRREHERKREGSQLECPPVPRERKSVTQLYKELGKGYFRGSFRSILAAHVVE